MGKSKMSIAVFYIPGLVGRLGAARNECREGHVVRVVIAALACTLLAGCDTMTGSNSGPGTSCTITAAVIPATATADHSLAVPGNQVQFSASSTVTGNCPLIADQLGSWSTSDPVKTALTTSTQTPTQTVATCHDATSTPATISYSGTVRGHSFATATLTCK
jgi:hypothetical protein